MIPDLGKYAAEVLSAYGASLVILAVLIGLSVRRARKVRRELEQLEGRRHETD
ncbi:heme exporter protein D [Salinihabitans flavidus]|uniref:Heme exporter protein D n=1 Tax=Salinihabitans flavidus TaxID=569882 RepID=A0A1H8RNR9_9RHOB|nr:heme exporter protein CcmD [Salinihabitans flavidus]SEO68006.1 heme exporter protein D [Salinihabitans flavidus]